MKTVVIVKADTNDADYISAETEVRNSSQIELVRKFASLLKASNAPHGQNFPYSDYVDLTLEDLYGDKVSQQELRVFRNMVPYGEHGVHTIQSIRIVQIVQDEELL